MDEIRYTESEQSVELRDATARELDIRVVPWDVVIHHDLGPEMFARGALDDVDPTRVVLKGPDPQGKHNAVAIGRGLSRRDDAEGSVITFRVSKTQAGDEALTLVSDGVVTKASVGFIEKAGGFSMQQRAGQRVRVQEHVDVDHVALTWRPAYQASGVIAMRSESEEEPKVSENQDVAQAAAAIDLTPVTSAITALQERNDGAAQRMLERLDKIEERDRSAIVMPRQAAEPDRKMRLLDWADYALKTLSGVPYSAAQLHERALDDIITADNPGVVPDAVSTDIIGIIDRSRPFLESTRQITAPDTGMSIVVPVLGPSRSETGVQAAEKTAIASNPLKVTSQSFDAITIAGGADVSIQMIRRATRSYLDLLISDLGTALARNCDEEAIATLLAAGTTPGGANINPEDLLLGEAWANSIDNYGQPPDTIWMSSAGVAAFIDAKDNGTNRSLYFTLNGNFGAGNAPGGSVSALRPVYVPALNNTSVDVMVGPSAGFAWAEDGSFQLSADNPTLAGRDIALVSILFFIPRYPAAFTTYDLGS